MHCSALQQRTLTQSCSLSTSHSRLIHSLNCAEFIRKWCNNNHNSNNSRPTNPGSCSMHIILFFFQSGHSRHLCSTFMYRFATIYTCLEYLFSGFVCSQPTLERDVLLINGRRDMKIYPSDVDMYEFMHEPTHIGYSKMSHLRFYHCGMFANHQT